MERVEVLDYHVGGEPLRIVTGLADIPGATMEVRRIAAQADFTACAGFVVAEPRGHADAFGVILTPPVRPDSVLGALFFDGISFKPACGHGAIALITAAVDEGWVQVSGGTNSFRLDVPAGQVRLDVDIQQGRAVSVLYHHVPSRLLARDLRIETSRGVFAADLGHSGGPVLLVDLGAVDMRIEPAQLAAFRTLYHEIRAGFTGAAQGLKHGIDMVQFYRERPAGDVLAYDTLTVFGDGAFDRSPCGAGTSARIAQLHARGRLVAGAQIAAISITGAVFEGSCAPDGLDAVLPMIRARAFVTGRQTLIRDPEDSLAAGFRL